MDIMAFLKENVRPATGCTEPVAVAYATALAYEALQPKFFRTDIEKIIIKTDRDVFKNAYAVTIPGTGGQKGMAIAAAMGLFCDFQKKLNLFEDMDESVAARAKEYLPKIQIKAVTDTEAQPELDIQVTIRGKQRQAFVRLRYDHENVAELIVDGQTRQLFSGQKKESRKFVLPQTLNEFLTIVQNMQPLEKAEVWKGLELNKKIAEEGLRKRYGAGMAHELLAMVKKNILADSTVMKVRIMAAAAGDARMGGVTMPVMSTSGSGNQGIAALIPILVIGEILQHKDKMIEAAMLAHLITALAAQDAGHLSALCGCAIKAGMGAAAGVAYLLGGNLAQITDAINRLAACPTGMICDGAKECCASKLETAAGKATECAYMAMGGRSLAIDNGIICAKVEDTIRAVGQISYSMVSTDATIVKILQNKA